MKKFSAIFLSIAVALTGCAAPGQSKTEATALSAAAGCAAGAALTMLAGGKASVGCVTGTAIGGIAGYLKARDLELSEMKKAAAEIPGAKVETQPVTVADKSTGETKRMDAFKALSVPLPPSSLTDPEGRRVYANLAALAQKHGAIASIACGTVGQRDQAAALLRSAGLAQVATDSTVKASAGRKGDLVVTLLPANKSTYIEV